MELAYTNLDPATAYTLTVLFYRTMQSGGHAGGANDELNTLVAGHTTLQYPARSPLPMKPLSFAVPRNETAGGNLHVYCQGLDSVGAAVPESGVSSCSIVAVWLEPTHVKGT